MGTLLGDRPFDGAEHQTLAEFHRRYGPSPERTEAAVADAVALKGPEKPLAYYLEAIERRLREGGLR